MAYERLCRRSPRFARSLTFDPVHNLLYAVNAGSNTVSVFSVYGDQLFLRQVINSGGQFPVSVAVHGYNVYVLNALSANVQGYISFFGQLFPLPDSDRSLGLTVPSNTNQFTNARSGSSFPQRDRVDRHDQVEQ